MTHIAQPETRRADLARYGVLHAPRRVEVLHARFQQHRFGEHAHDGWALGAVLSGAKDIAPRAGQPNRLARGDVYALAPHQAHAGKTVGEAGCEYAMIYVPDAEWRLQCAARGMPAGWLSSAAAAHAPLSDHVRAFVALALQHPQRLATWPGEWQLFWDGVWARWGAAQQAPGAPPAAPDWRVERAREYLRAHYADEVTLDTLAQAASLSVFALCRKFAAAYGLSPHRYQLVLRVHEAKARLLRGGAIGDVAADTGFADQSHLGRHFKSLLGITPGAVARQAARARTF
ncbi:AraC family transcriptional regulator [Cupriavidus sp. 30B13]|uniref:AraC family transcriptional regulator n=1 Tax=Cupriavidus sp. 30B13 TaxID=3384241 RepID=UPI003B90FC18